MATKIYGISDDLVEFEGDFNGEYSCYGSDEEGHPGILICMSDGTILSIKYGKNDKAIWDIRLLERGALFLNIDQCCDEDKDIYSDIAYFKDGIKWAYGCNNWQKIK